MNSSTGKVRRADVIRGIRPIRVSRIALDEVETLGKNDTEAHQ